MISRRSTGTTVNLNSYVYAYSNPAMSFMPWAADCSGIVDLVLGARLVVRGTVKVLSSDDIQTENQPKKQDFARFLKSVSEHATLVQEFFEDEEYLDEDMELNAVDDPVQNSVQQSESAIAPSHSELMELAADLASAAVDYAFITAEALCADGLLDVSLGQQSSATSQSASPQSAPVPPRQPSQQQATPAQQQSSQTAGDAPATTNPTNRAWQWPVIQSAETAIQIALNGQDTQSDIVISLKPNNRQLIGERLLQAGLLSASQISLIVLVDQKLYPEFKFGEILRLRNWLQQATLEFFINIDKLCTPDFCALPLGERLVRAGLITPADVQTALNMQHDSQPYMRFGEILVKQGLMKQVTVDYFAQLQI